MGRAQTLTEESIIYLPASELISLFKSKELSPVDLLKAQIDRYQSVNELINCVTYTHFESAMKQARQSEERYLRGTARPLEGITVGVKDEHHDAGWIMTQGSILEKDSRQDSADPVVQKLKQSGAVLPIQTTVPEFYLNAVTWTRLWGVSRCPWNLKYTVGGSSGGSGGALAAGMCTLATGSDMGGSIRLPCAYNGLYGFKPPFGRFHSDLPLSYFAGSGPMARTFQDMISLYNVISGPDKYSPNTLPKEDLPYNYPNIRGTRIAYSQGLGLAEPDTDTQRMMQKAIAVLRSAGAVVDEVDINPGYRVEDTTELFVKGALGGAMGGWLADMADRSDEMTTYAASFVKKAASGKYGNQAVYEYERFVNSFHSRVVDTVFGNGYQALIMPSLITSHVPADYDLTKGGFMMNGSELYSGFIFAYTAPWNFLNWYPVVNVPTGLTAQGMPSGMQIIGSPYRDSTVMQIAHSYAALANPLFVGDRVPEFKNA
ncbi:amidase [Synechococcus sp. RSCCF101]|uniref:amidase n=1 Tax=Synechococcus sp. RSCCF101 TaxID=2511069 RepID=UPI00177EE79A|nr:amidase [Synechococcus sp. RSCCF101]